MCVCLCFREAAHLAARHSALFLLHLKLVARLQLGVPLGLVGMFGYGGLTEF